MKKALLALAAVGLLTGCSTYGPYQEFHPAPDAGQDCYTRIYTPKYEEGEDRPASITYGPYCNIKPEQSTPPAPPFKDDE